MISRIASCQACEGGWRLSHRRVVSLLGSLLEHDRWLEALRNQQCSAAVQTCIISKPHEVVKDTDLDGLSLVGGIACIPLACVPLETLVVCLSPV